MILVLESLFTFDCWRLRYMCIHLLTRRFCLTEWFVCWCRLKNRRSKSNICRRLFIKMVTAVSFGYIGYFANSCAWFSVQVLQDEGFDINRGIHIIVLNQATVSEHNTKTLKQPNQAYQANLPVPAWMSPTQPKSSQSAKELDKLPVNQPYTSFS